MIFFSPTKLQMIVFCQGSSKMEEDSNNNKEEQLREEACSKKKEKLQDCLLSARSWRDLPSELLSDIANNLGIFDLLGFRGVCSGWRSSSITASAAIESAPDNHPYFLLHSDSDEKCILFNPTTNKQYNINIPELNETTCLASSHGWLLLSQKGLIFFFCPLSRARIDLPSFQESKIFEGAAAFTSPPLSIDCATAIICRKNYRILEVNVLERGVSSWVKYEFDLGDRFFGMVRGATFADGCFHILDDEDGLVTFDLKNNHFKIYKVVIKGGGNYPSAESLQFLYKEKYFRRNGFRKRMKLGKDVTISACAASYAGSDDSVILIKNEEIKAKEEFGTRDFKGIWIQPRFFQLPPNYCWEKTNTSNIYDKEANNVKGSKLGRFLTKF
nr:uncharacterized protein LOC104092630 [Nicotiana tomentosiformis]